MLRHTLGALILCASAVHGQGLQRVLSPNNDLSGLNFSSPTDNNLPRLNFSSPSPLIFHSTFALLQQWPNTFFEYGHTIAPCKVPKGTNLYHASSDGKRPPEPEFLAFDPEMAYWILGTTPDSHMFTYRTRREVQCLYFDGSSASLRRDGSMDSQMAFLYNSTYNIPPKPILELPPEFRNLTGNKTFFNDIALEYTRAEKLCDFIHNHSLGGPGWGYEGVVRMNTGFEMIWCNFSSPSVELVSRLNVSAPRLEEVPSRWTHLGHVPETFVVKGRKKRGKKQIPGLTFDNPFAVNGGVYSWWHAATKRYGFGNGQYGRGETRVRLDSCTLFTLYDPGMQDQESARVMDERKSLNLTKEGYWMAPREDNERDAALKTLSRRRQAQRAHNVSEADGLYMRGAVEQRMRLLLSTEKEQHCSGIDWIEIARDIVSAYSIELYNLLKRLEFFGQLGPEDARLWLSDIRHASHLVFMPFYEYPDITKSTLQEAFAVNASNSQSALHRCKTQYAPFEAEELSDSERLTSHAISDVLSAICTTMLPIFLQTERIWLANFNNFSAPPVVTPAVPLWHELQTATSHNIQAIEELMAWLGWIDQWTACDPGCALGQVCYIPIWPALAMGGILKGGMKGHEDLDEADGSLDRYLWEPTCVDFHHFPPGW
ncbi:hypothetical protein BDY17DRAFT_43195 [Neohortaea acidophila]|uniref:Uncharacterized protein n=1 Tax=Neohortaea acidophila TaxID=245834 RepID=A0A6A6PJH1_9PEZI|nr:uncharacterized protein BDY17DRAFT_43195 [Neohortaea acidophila]KAF2479673.1 hypothetical protein BDY17DRAFT_43195 [Neohortaea acidophila]